MPIKLVALAMLPLALWPLAARADERSPAAEPPPIGDASRFEMSPIEGGFARLDKQTGAIAMCTPKNDRWICEDVSVRTDRESEDALARLERENEDLKARLKALEDKAAGGGAAGEPPPAAGPQLPSEEEVDQALDYVERMFKKFRDRIKRLDEPPPADPGAARPDSKQL